MAKPLLIDLDELETVLDEWVDPEDFTIFVGSLLEVAEPIRPSDIAYAWAQRRLDGQPARPSPPLDADSNKIVGRIARAKPRVSEDALWLAEVLWGAWDWRENLSRPQLLHQVRNALDGEWTMAAVDELLDELRRFGILDEEDRV